VKENASVRPAPGDGPPAVFDGNPRTGCGTGRPQMSWFCSWHRDAMRRGRIQALRLDGSTATPTPIVLDTETF
jgi:hypothetical protein